MHGGYLSFDERREPGTAAPACSNAPQSVHRVLRRRPLVEVHTTSRQVFGANFRAAEPFRQLRALHGRASPRTGSVNTNGTGTRTLEVAVELAVVVAAELDGSADVGRGD